MVKILLVDDDQLILNGLEKDLRNIGVIRMALSGEQAMKLLQKENDIKLALIDIKMPGMSGIELLKVIKKKYPEVGVIMVTAFGAMAGMLDNVNKCRKLSIFSFIEKPYDPEVLRTSVKRYLRKRPQYLKFVEKLQKSTKLYKSKPGVIHITIADGFLDKLQREFENLLHEANCIVLDMKNVYYVSDIGIMLLIKLHRKTNLILKNLQKGVKRQLDVFCGEDIKFNIKNIIKRITKSE
jgi:YesN/AraC family two-component response regulator